jgi:hypothetical protein
MTAEWTIIKAPVTGLKSEVQNLFISIKDDKLVEIDWSVLKNQAGLIFFNKKNLL